MGRAGPYLKKLAEKYGNEWPLRALDRLLDLYAEPLDSETFEEAAEEYVALYSWASEMIEAGLASKQDAAPA